MASWIDIWLQKLDDRVVENGGSLEVDMMPELTDLTRELLARISFGSSYQKGKEGFDHMEIHKNLLLKRGYLWNPLQRCMFARSHIAFRRLICVRHFYGLIERGCGRSSPSLNSMFQLVEFVVVTLIVA